MFNTKYNKAVYTTLWNAACLVVFLGLREFWQIEISGEFQGAVQGLGSAIAAFIVPNAQ